MAKLSHNTAIYLLGGVVAAGGNILLAPAYLRLLSAEQYGLWSRFLLVQQLLQIPMTWGMLAAMSRLMAGAAPSDQARLTTAALRLTTGLNAALLALIAATSLIPDSPARFIPLEARLFLLAAAVAALSAYPNILLGRFVAAGAALRHRGLSLLGFGLQVTLLGVFALTGVMDAVRSALAMLLAALLFASVCALQLVRQGAGSAGPTEYKALLSFGLPVLLYTAAAQANDVAMRVGLTTAVGPAEFGAFSAVLLYASVLAMIASAVNLAWIPLFYRHAAKWLASGVYRDFALLLAAVLATLAAFLIVFSAELLGLYSGGRLRQDEHTVGWLVSAAWLNSAVWTGLTNPLFEQKRTRTTLLIALVAMAISVPVGLWLIYRNGIPGACAALWLNALLMCLMAAASLRQSAIIGPSPAKLLGLLAMLALLSSPVLSGLYQMPAGAARWLGKGVLLAAFAAVAAAMSWRPGLHALATIENADRP